MNLQIYRTCFLTDINECLSNPCPRRASCNNEINAYSCTCVQGFTGDDCESGRFYIIMDNQTSTRCLAQLSITR